MYNIVVNTPKEDYEYDKDLLRIRHADHTKVNIRNNIVHKSFHVSMPPRSIDTADTAFSPLQEATSIKWNLSSRQGRADDILCKTTDMFSNI